MGEAKFRDFKGSGTSTTHRRKQKGQAEVAVPRERQYVFGRSSSNAQEKHTGGPPLSPVSSGHVPSHSFPGARFLSTAL